MIEKKFVQMKKEEFIVKEFVKRELGKGKISSVIIERTPVGEKITMRTSKPGLIIGRRGEKIAILTEVLKKRFKLENPHIEIEEIKNPDLDAWSIADELALALERTGPVGFKLAAYKMLDRIKRAGALGAEIRLGGKLPSERARHWRFAFGLLKKTGDTAKVVDRARIAAQTIPGVIGIKVEIMPPDASATLEFAEINLDAVKNKFAQAQYLENLKVQDAQQSAQSEKIREEKSEKSEDSKDKAEEKKQKTRKRGRKKKEK